MTWETLQQLRYAAIRRSGRYLVVDLRTPHQVLSTSVRNGGLTTHVRHLVNHQSCEGTAHDARFRAITELGQEAYHAAVCAEIALSPDETVTMGTAANMNYAAVKTLRDAGVEVTAVVTAGVASNAVAAGDPAAWRETVRGMEKVPPPATPQAADVAAVAGTINTLLVIDTPLTPGALARTIVTMVEGKSAALQRLAVPSCYSQELATGTGTDQFCIAAPLASTDADFATSSAATRGAAAGGGAGARPGTETGVNDEAERPAIVTAASPHMKFGEIVGAAVRDATLEALRWQNGLEPSYTRGLFHALGRYGIKLETIFDALADQLDPVDLELLRKNSNAAFYEPLVGAAAHALATTLDRVRHGTLPPSAAPDAVVQQAALLAASMAARPDRWTDFRARLHATALALRARDGGAPLTRDTIAAQARPLILAAVALGWSEKWRQG